MLPNNHISVFWYYRVVTRYFGYMILSIIKALARVYLSCLFAHIHLHLTPHQPTPDDLHSVGCCLSMPFPSYQPITRAFTGEQLGWFQ